MDDRPRLAKPDVNRIFGALKKKLTPTSGSAAVELCGRDMFATTLDMKPPITLSGRVIGKAANHNADAMAVTADFTASVKIWTGSVPAAAVAAADGETAAVVAAAVAGMALVVRAWSCTAPISIRRSGTVM